VTPSLDHNNNDDEKIDKLIEVGPKNKSWYGYPLIGRFVLKDETLLPTMDSSSHKLHFRLDGYPAVPRLKFDIVSGPSDDPDDDSSFPLSVEFLAADVKGLRTSVLETSDEKTCILISVYFTSDGGITIGLDEPCKDEAVDLLRKHMRQISLKGSEVELTLFVPNEIWRDGEILKMLNSLTSSPVPWYAYRSSRTLAPMTQYGQLRTRSHVEQMWNLNSDMPIFKIPPSNHFYNLAEAAIKLVYASNLEHEITLIHLKRLHGVQYNISLFKVPESNIVLAAVQFGTLNEKFTPNSMVDKVPNIPDATQCKVSMDQTDRAHSVDFTAISVPSVMAVPTQYDLLLLLSPSKPGFNVDLCVNPLSLRQKAKKSFSCKIKFEISTSNVKAQTHAINTLCTPAFSR
jgi:hypothetical protein